MKHFIIEEKLFKLDVLFVYNCASNELEKLLNKKYEFKNVDLSWMEQNVSGCVLDFENKGYHKRIVYLKKFKKNNIEDLSVLVHELTHLAIRICESRGIAIKANLEDGRVNDEPIAYMMGYFMREFLTKAYK